MSPGRSLLDGLRDIGDALITRLGDHRTTEAFQALRLTIVQFGDYAEAYTLLAGGGAENYYGQKYSVEFVGSLVTRKEIESVTVICASSDASGTTLPNGINTSSVELYPKERRPRHDQLVEAVKQTRPTHLIVMTPCMPVIRWGIRARIPVLPMFADSFQGGGFKASVRNRLLAFLLNEPSIEIVSNHSLAASLELKRMGVDPNKIVPFDWPALISPQGFEPKNAPIGDRPFRLIFVGSVIETKGVGDAIQAVAKLRQHGRKVELTVIGRGDLERFKSLAIAEQVGEQVSFLGSKSHSAVVSAMREHDAVLVPSRWAYPEGLPMTLYEALCTRTPLLTSDHPMFALKIRDRYNALVFPERNPEAFAQRIDELASTPELYVNLSIAAGKAAESYLCPLKYDRLISDFLAPKERSRLRAYSLAEYVYH